jgi:nicotinate-nucleotide pyrophosphorylase (carboxylating)
MKDESDGPNSAILEAIVRAALKEDIGIEDVTTLATVAVDARASAQIVASETGVLAGIPVVCEVFRQLNPGISVAAKLEEGARFDAGNLLAGIKGPARGVLAGERVALNFLQRMCGIATLTAQFVERVAGTNARIVDTRKTTPGLRALEKYAVRVGGGHNHRMGLYDAVMIKDNHIVAAGGITKAVKRARTAVPHTMTITVECESLDQVNEALSAGAEILLLDNMDNATRIEAVSRTKGRALTEASGGVTLETVAEIARTGVDIISVGALTHSARAIDMSLEMVEST